MEHERGNRPAAANRAEETRRDFFRFCGKVDSVPLKTESGIHTRCWRVLLMPSVELPSLRALAYGGGKMPLSVIESAMRLFPNVDFTNAYGLTKTSSTIAVLGPQDHRDAAANQNAEVRRRLLSVGRPLSCVEVEIRDDEGRGLVSYSRCGFY